MGQALRRAGIPDDWTGYSNMYGDLQRARFEACIPTELRRGFLERLRNSVVRPAMALTR